MVAGAGSSRELLNDRGCPAAVKPAALFIIKNNRFLRVVHVLRILMDAGFRRNETLLKRIRKGRDEFVRWQCSTKSSSARNERISRINGEASISITRYRPARERTQQCARPSSIRALTLNINGMKAKKEELEAHLEEHPAEILCIQETHAGESDRPMYLQRYVTHEARSRETGRGLLIGVRKGSGVVLLDCVESSPNLLCAKLLLGSGRLTVANVYMPCQATEKKRAMERLKDVLLGDPPAKVVALGDFNTPPGELLTRLMNKGVRMFGEMLPNSGTRLCNGNQPSHRIIDFCISNAKGRVLRQTPLMDWAISDHSPVLIEIAAGTLTSPMEGVVVKVDRDMLKNANVKKGVANFNFRACSAPRDTASLVSDFQEDALACLRLHKVLTSKATREQRIKLPEQVIRLIKRKKERLASHAPGPECISAVKELNLLIRKASVQFRRLQYKKFIQKGVQALRDLGPRDSWKWIKLHCGVKKQGLPGGPIYNARGELVTEEPEIVEAWRCHFEALFKKDGGSDPPLEALSSDEGALSAKLSEEISWLEVVTELARSRCNKAAGEDLIPVEFLKVVERETEPTTPLARALISVLNAVLDAGKIPVEWQSCTVVPIFKKGDEKDPGNYRGIALMNVILKVLCKIMARRLQEAVESYGLLSPEQAGFMRKQESVGQATCLLEILQRRCKIGKATFLCFLDLKKAYDLVGHQKLIEKLRLKGLGGKALRFLVDLYASTKVKIRVGDKLSGPCTYGKGVRQGCPLSPLCFNIFIDDLLKGLKGILVLGMREPVRGLLFADDTVIFAESEWQLNEAMQQVSLWMEKNGMEINVGKCGAMVVGGAPGATLSIAYREEPIVQVHDYVYLGVCINDDLDIDRMARHRAGKGAAVESQMAQTLHSTRIPLEYKRMLISSVLCPSLLYGTECFGMSERRMKPLETIMNRAVKRCFGRSRVCLERAYEELEITRLPIQAAANRARAISKWRSAGGMISKVLQSAGNLKTCFHLQRPPAVNLLCPGLGALSTWATSTLEWLRKEKIVLGDPANARSKLIAIKNARRAAAEKSSIGRTMRLLKACSGKPVRIAEVRSAGQYIGLNLLSRLRTGSYCLTNDFVRMGLLDQEWIDRCAFCEHDTKEDLRHLLLRCPAFASEREHTLRRLIEGVVGICRADREEDLILRRLLGGAVPIAGEHAWENVLITAKYLFTIAAKRKATIERHESRV